MNIPAIQETRGHVITVDNFDVRSIVGSINRPLMKSGCPCDEQYNSGQIIWQ